jgi:hypothetical protein
MKQIRMMYIAVMLVNLELIVMIMLKCLEENKKVISMTI